MSTFNPTIEQLAAINSNECSVITACPGSGKTAVVSAKVRAILPSLPQYKGVIAISYTNKASAELRRRCAENATDVKRSYFGTIDSFCLREVIFPFLPHFIDKRIEVVEVSKPEGLSEAARAVYEESLQNNDLFFSKSIELYTSGTVVLTSTGRLACEILTRSQSCQNYIKARYSHVFIDEYQDSGIDQHRLFMLLKSIGLVAIAVGDTRQSIYAFAGRDPRFLKGLCSPGTGFQHFQLTQNHRSHPSIINYSNRLLDENSALLPSDAVRVYRSAIAGGPADIAAWIDVKMPKIVEFFKIDKLRDIGILVKGSATASILQETLQTKCRVARDSALEHSKLPASHQFASILRMRLNPSATVQGLMDEIGFVGDRAKKLVLRHFLRQCKEGPLDNLKSSILEVLKIIDGAYPNADAIAELELALADGQEISALSEPADDAIQLMTLHKSKGLEFDVVIHLDLHDWVIPKRLVVPGDFSEHFENYEQCLNLHYVGVTRAKKACILATSTRRINSLGIEKNGVPSQFFALPGLKQLYKGLN